MTKKKVKQILLWAGGISFCLLMTLVIHIYLVTRPKPPAANTRIMVRMDVKKDISQQEAADITAWLYSQQGVDRVMINAETDIVVFTFFPVQTNADKVLAAFRKTFSYPVQRYMPDEAAMAKGCPAMAPSLTAKLSGMFSHFF